MLEIHCEDALERLEARAPLPGASRVDSLPEISEFPAYALVDWQAWFVRAAAR